MLNWPSFCKYNSGADYTTPPTVILPANGPGSRGTDVEPTAQLTTSSKMGAKKLSTPLQVPVPKISEVNIRRVNADGEVTNRRFDFNGQSEDKLVPRDAPFAVATRAPLTSRLQAGETLKTGASTHGAGFPFQRAYSQESEQVLDARTIGRLMSIPGVQGNNIQLQRPSPRELKTGM